MKRALFTLLLLSFLLIKPVSIQAAGAKLNFVPDNLVINQNESASVQIQLDPGGNQIIGVDLFIRFDPALIQVNQITSLGVFSTQTALQIDNQAGLAKAAYSNGYGIYTTKLGNIAEIQFQGKNTTKITALAFDFIYGKTNDTNVAIAQGKDVLNQVGSVQIEVKSTSSNSNNNQPSPTPSSTSTIAVSSPTVQALNTINQRGQTASPLIENQSETQTNPSIPYLSDIKTQAGEILGVSSNNSFLNYKNGFWLLLGLIGLYLLIKFLRKIIFPPVKR